jgi:hypothetical protein
MLEGKMKPENRELLIRTLGMVDALYSIVSSNEKDVLESVSNFIDTVLEREGKDESNS